MNQADLTPQAAPTVDDKAAKSGLAPRMIAYLSLGMLAAAFGSLIGPDWCRWWAIFGTFGLAAGIGLDVLHRSRARLAADTRKRQVALKAERKLDEMMGHIESSSAIRAALHEFEPEAADSAPQGANGQAEPRLPLNKPVTIVRLFRSFGDGRCRLGEPLAGRLLSITHYGFGLAHDQRLERGPVLLEFELDNDEPIQFIAEVLWCELRDSGCYFSGGKLLEVASPSEAPPARYLSHAAQREESGGRSGRGRV